MTANANMILAHGLTYPTILASTPLPGCSDNSGRAMMHTTHPGASTGGSPRSRAESMIEAGVACCYDWYLGEEELRRHLAGGHPQRC